MQVQTHTPAAADPFALMMNPQAVLEAIGRSDRLAGLKSKVYRPLDKPLIPHRNAELAAYDDAIDEDLVEDELDTDDDLDLAAELGGVAGGASDDE